MHSKAKRIEAAKLVYAQTQTRRVLARGGDNFCWVGFARVRVAILRRGPDKMERRHADT